MDICYKNLNYLLNLLINCMSARSALEMLSIKGEYTFFFLKFFNNWFV